MAMSYKLLSVIEDPDNRGEHIITVNRTPDMLSAMVGFKEESLRFQSRETAWHEIPSGNRPTPKTELHFSHLVVRYFEEIRQRGTISG